MGAPLNGDHKPIPFLRTEFNESSGQFFLPMDHWIAYTSDESGDDEIFVREFSLRLRATISGCRGQWLISKGGGTDPRWRGDGKELFYVASDGKLMSVDVSAKPVFEVGTPKPLFQLPPGFIGGDFTPDGKRFPHRCASGAKRFRTLYGGALLADDLEEISGNSAGGNSAT